MDDDEVRQAMSLLDTFRAQLDALTKQSQILQISLQDTVKAHETLKAMAQAKPGDEILIPVGGGTLVRAVVSENTNALVGIGSKLSVDMKAEEAIEYMSSNSKEITEALKKLTETMEEMSSKAQALQVAVQEEYRARQELQANTGATQ